MLFGFRARNSTTTTRSRCRSFLIKSILGAKQKKAGEEISPAHFVYCGYDLQFRFVTAATVFATTMFALSMRLSLSVLLRMLLLLTLGVPLLLSLCMLLLLILSMFLWCGIRMNTRLLGRVLSTLLSETAALLYGRVILTRCPGRGILRMAAVHGSEITPIRMCHLHMVLLLPGRRDMVLPRKRSLLRRRASLDATGPAIEARTVINRRMVDHGPVFVDIVDHRPVHIHHRGVIRKVATLPASAAKTNAAVAKPIVHATVETNVGTPIPCMKEVSATTPSPVTRRPQQTNLRWSNPHARNPVITVTAISPITRIPQIPVARADRLRINRQHRRRNPDRNKHAGKRSCRQKRKSRTHYKLTD